MIVRFALAMVVLITAGCSGLVRNRIFQPQTLSETPVSWTTSAPENLSVQTADGLTLDGYYWPADPGNRTLIVSFHGNGFNQLVGAERAEPFRTGGHGVLVASYRGYGSNPGRPSEDGLMLDGDAWMKKAAELAPTSKRYVFGHSLGGAVALAMAGKHPVDGVATLGTFTNMAAMVPSIARGSLQDRFDNLAAIREIEAPIYLYHGTNDQLVPFASAETLRAAGGDNVTVVPLERGGHHVPMALLAELVWKIFETQ